MKGLKETIPVKNPNQYNGESLHISPHTKVLQGIGDQVNTNNKKVYIESYGCQMNFSDSEIVASILSKEGYATTKFPEDADLVLINTCSIREKAELTIRKRLEKFNALKKKKSNFKVGVLGCMA